MRARLSERRGQTAAEYLGLLLVVSVIVAVIAESDLPGRMRAALRQQICVVFNDARDCPDAIEAAREQRRRDATRRAARRDSDGDGVPDVVERRHGTDPHSPDSDRDGLSDAVELAHGSDPNNADTDGDGLLDGQDPVPNADDVDHDGLGDGEEVALGSDPRKADSDGDGVSDLVEFRQGTDPIRRVLPLTEDNALKPWLRVGMTKEQWTAFAREVLDEANPHGLKGFLLGQPYVAVNLDSDGHVKLIELQENGVSPSAVLRALGMAGKAAEGSVLAAATRLPAAIRTALAARGVIPSAIRFKPPPAPPASPGVALNELDGLGRATGAAATIDRSMLRTGSAVPPATKVAGFEGRVAGQSRGHLIAKVLGGAGDDTRNLVTLYQNPVNSPVMRGFERKVLNAVEEGQTVTYQVTPIYRGSELVPRAVTMTANGSGGFSLRVTVLNTKP